MTEQSGINQFLYTGPSSTGLFFDKFMAGCSSNWLLAMHPEGLGQILTFSSDDSYKRSAVQKFDNQLYATEIILNSISNNN